MSYLLVQCNISKWFESTVRHTIPVASGLRAIHMYSFLSFWGDCLFAFMKICDLKESCCILGSKPGMMRVVQQKHTSLHCPCLTQNT